jgi:LysR family transcriptional regulator, regulator for metE and metH
MADALHLEDDPTPLAMVELRHVRLVVAVLRFGSLTRAGEHLNLTQSALSHQLREIEDRLGVQLFLRVRKKLVPTEFCEAILQPCRDVLRAFSSLEHHVRLRSKRGQVIRITTETYTCYNWLPPVLHALEHRYPEARVQIVTDATEDVENALLDGMVDLALTTTVSMRNDVHMHRLFRDELLLVTSPGHELLSRNVAVPSDLRGERLILSTPAPANRFYQEFFRDGGGPREIAVVKLTDTIVSLVAAGLGVAPMPRWTVENELATGAVGAMRLAGVSEREWLALTRATDRTSGEMDELIALISARSAPKRARARDRR